MNLIAPDEHQLLVFWAQLSLLLLAARLLGQLMKHIGQPAVAGELAAGLVLGANLRQIEGRRFLGHVVKNVLEECDTTVVVVATPSGPHG